MTVIQMDSTMPGYMERMARYDWQEKRAERLVIDNHECQTCKHGGSVYQLEVHHKTYERFGEENVAQDLITLCSECHEAITNVIRARRYKKKDLGCNYIVPIIHQRKDIVR